MRSTIGIESSPTVLIVPFEKWKRVFIFTHNDRHVFT
jgi:hypothetical protein